MRRSLATRVIALASLARGGRTVSRAVFSVTRSALCSVSDPKSYNIVELHFDAPEARARNTKGEPVSRLPQKLCRELAGSTGSGGLKFDPPSYSAAASVIGTTDT